MTRDEFVSALQELTDLLEQKPGLSVAYVRMGPKAYRLYSRFCAESGSSPVREGGRIRWLWQGSQIEIVAEHGDYFMQVLS